MAPLLRGHGGPVVFGDDWNHSLQGIEKAGSKERRAAIVGLLGELGLAAPTAALPHRAEGLASIDHIAVPAAWTVADKKSVIAEGPDGRRLSDHDAYVVEAGLVGSDNL